MADYRVNLDIFSGPLDLLLYLVRKEEVDIYDIPISKITEQYLRYVEMLKSLDIDLAGDFLVMAATLMQIKSAMLLPKADPEQLQADELADPRAELIRQLLEYKKFKDAANLLDDAADRQKQRYPRPDSIIERLKPDTQPQIDIEQIGVWDLLEAFDSIMKATGSFADISHIKDDTPIDLYQIDILHRLQAQGPMSFERLFESCDNRLVMIGLFLALLELIREGLVWAKQPASSTSIYLKPLTDEAPEQAVQKAIAASDAQASNNKPAQSGQHKKSTIPISELPQKTKNSSAVDEYEKIPPPERRKQQKED
ncbi:MAG: segregation and condensation protein A [Planctomycetota bacterium]